MSVRSAVPSDARADTASAVLERAPATTAASDVVWLVAAIAFGNGVLMIVAPSQFRGPAYAPIVAALAPYGLLLISAAALLAFAATGGVSARRAPYALLLGSVPLLYLGSGFLRSGVITGVLTLGLQVGAVLVVAALMLRGVWPRERAFVWLAAAIQVAQAAAMLVVPAQFAVPALYGQFATGLAFWTASFFIAGVGLAVSERWHLRLGRVGFGGLAAANFASLAMVFMSTRIWTGVLNYALMSFLLAVGIWGRGDTRRTALLLASAAAALALIDLGGWVAKAAGVQAFVPDAATMRPTVAAVFIAAAVGVAAATTKAWPRRVAIAAAVVAATTLAVAAATIDHAQHDAQTLFGTAGEPQPTAAAVFAASLAAAALVALVWRLSGTWTPHIVGAIAAALLVIGFLNALAYVLDLPELFVHLSILGMRLHTGVASLFFAAGLLLLVVPAIIRGPIGGRIFAGLGVVLALVFVQMFIATQSSLAILRATPEQASRVDAYVRAADAAIVGIGVLLVIALGAIGVMLTRTITRPIHQLTGAIERFAAGDAGVRLRTTRDDEIGVVARAFDQMADEIAVARRVLEHQAWHDALTGLPNRRLLDDRIEQALAVSARTKTPVAFVSIDVDKFKDINDGYGHDAGDQVLREVAARLRTVIRTADTLARVGGDEFVMLLLGAEGAIARSVAERIAGLFREPLNVAGRQLVVGLSIGIALHPEHAQGGDDLLRLADRAMYQSKRTRLPYAVHGAG